MVDYKKLIPKFESVAEVLSKYQKEIDNIKARLDEKDSPFVSDVVCYRFFRAWNFNEEKTISEMNATLRWRKQNGVDEIRRKVVTMDQKDFPHARKIASCYPQTARHKFDKSGQMIVLEGAGKINVNLLLKTVNQEELLENQIWVFEQKEEFNMRMTEQTGKVYRICQIIDLTGLNISHASRSVLRGLRAIIEMGAAHYPDSLGSMYIVNAPSLFTAIWRMVQPWLREGTKQKISILGPTDSPPKLLEVVDSESLPTILGGKCTCADKGGCIVLVDPDAELQKSDIARGDSHKAVVKVEEGHVVSWTHRLVKHTIGFSVLHYPEKAAAEGECKIVHKTDKMEASLKHESGSFTAPAAGHVHLVWDNSFSRFTGKTVLYRVEVGSVDGAGGGGGRFNGGGSGGEFGVEEVEQSTTTNNKTSSPAGSPRSPLSAASPTSPPTTASASFSSSASSSSVSGSVTSSASASGSSSSPSPATGGQEEEEDGGEDEVSADSFHSSTVPSTSAAATTQSKNSNARVSTASTVSTSSTTTTDSKSSSTSGNRASLSLSSTTTTS